MYAKLNRTAIRIALCIAALGGVSLTHAGYAQLAAPPGFSVSGGGFGYAASANDAVFGRVIHQPAGLTANVAGQAVKMPAAYRLAANAPRIAAAAIFANPYVRTGVGIAAWLGISGLIWDDGQKIWRQQVDKSEYAVKQYRWDQSYPWTTSHTAACQTIVEYYNQLDAGSDYSSSIKSCGADGQVIRNRRWKGEAPGTDFSHSLEVREMPAMECPVNWTATPAGCLGPGLTQPEMVELLNPANQPGWPMPETVPLELPKPTRLPVEQPFINPEPGPNPAHRPQFVPTGNPVPNPNYDPNSPVGPANQPYFQPGVRIVPSPTHSNPWQVDMQPVERPVGSADPNPEPQPDPEPGDGDKPKLEDQQSLCEKHPDILACSKPDLDTPEDEIPRETRDVSYQPESLFGGGVCPSNKTMSTHGMQLTVWDWQESCGYITGYFRPVILVLCAFAAFVIVSGGSRQS